jgi:hypothetical protein
LWHGTVAEVWSEKLDRPLYTCSIVVIHSLAYPIDHIEALVRIILIEAHFEIPRL